MTLERLPLERLTPWLIVAVALGALSTALLAQHLYDLEPCILCLYQRLPFVATALLALAALKFPTGSAAIAPIIGLCALTYLGGAGIAVYHVGVEQHWWVSGCTGAPAAELSFDQLRAALSTKPAKSCDDVDWTLFGISMATYNVPFSAAMAAISFMAARAIWKKNEPKKTDPIQPPAR